MLFPLALFQTRHSRHVFLRPGCGWVFACAMGGMLVRPVPRIELVDVEQRRWYFGCAFSLSSVEGRESSRILISLPLWFLAFRAPFLADFKGEPNGKLTPFGGVRP